MEFSISPYSTTTTHFDTDFQPEGCFFLSFVCDATPFELSDILVSLMSTLYRNMILTVILKLGNRTWSCVTTCYITSQHHKRSDCVWRYALFTSSIATLYVTTDLLYWWSSLSTQFCSYMIERSAVLVFPIDAIILMTRIYLYQNSNIVVIFTQDEMRHSLVY